MANPLSPRASTEINVMNAQLASNATFTAATSDVITSSAHGMSNGDVITVASSTTLPAGLSASTYYFIISADTNTFKVSTTPGGSAVDITDTGTGTHTWYREREGDNIDVNEFRHIEVSIDLENSPDVTIKCVGAITDSLPSFLNPQTVSNRYDFIQVVDKEDAATIDGDTGIAFAASGNRQVVVNVDGLSFITFKTLNYKAGDITIKMKGFRN